MTICHDYCTSSIGHWCHPSIYFLSVVYGLNVRTGWQSVAWMAPTSVGERANLGLALLVKNRVNILRDIFATLDH